MGYWDISLDSLQIFVIPYWNPLSILLSTEHLPSTTHLRRTKG